LAGLLLVHLASLAQDTPTLRLQNTHEATVLQVCYSKTGEWVASSGDDNQIKVWQNETGKLVQTFDNQGHPAEALAFHPGMNQLVSSSGNAILVWDIKTGEVVGKLEGHDRPIHALAFSHDGKWLASAGDDPQIVVWDMQERKKEKELVEKIEYTNTYLALQFSLDDQLLFAAGEDIYIKAWDWRRKRVEYKLAMHPNSINDLALSPMGTLLASASNDHTVKIWNLSNREEAVTLSYPGFAAQSVAFHPSEDKVVVGYFKSLSDSLGIANRSLGKTVLWNLNKNQMEWEVVENSGVRCISPHPLGQDFLACTGQKQIVQRGYANGLAYKSFGISTEINDIALVEERDELLVASDDGLIKVWDLNEGRIKGVIDTKMQGAVTAMSYDPSTGQLLTAVENVLQYWMYDEASQRFREVNVFQVPGGQVNGIEFTRDFSSILLSRTVRRPAVDNQELLSLYNGGVIPDFMQRYTDSAYLEVWNPYRGQMVSRFEDFDPRGRGVAAHPSQRSFVFHNGRNEVVECQMQQGYALAVLEASGSREATGNTLATLNAQMLEAGLAGAVDQGRAVRFRNAPVTSMAYSSDGKYVAFGSQDGVVKVMDTQSRAMWTLSQFANPIADLCFDENNYYLAVAHGSSIELWAPTLMRQIGTFEDGRGIRKVIFYDQGRRLASASLEGGVRVWDVESLKPLAQMVCVGEQDYVCLVEPMYYRSSENGGQGVGIYFHGKTFPLEQFHSYFNRPDLVLARLGDQSEMAARTFERINAIRNANTSPGQLSDDDIFHLPTVEILNRESIRSRSRAGKVVLNIMAQDSRFRLDRLEVCVNKVPVFGQQGLDLRRFDTDWHKQDLHLELVEGVNVIEIKAININGVESLSQSVEIYNSEDPEPKVMHLVGLGVSRFADAAMNLAYATKDVNDLLAYFGQQPLHYDSIVVHRLFDQDFTMDNLNRLKAKLGFTETDDHVMVFFAGSAILDADMNYFLATSSVNFAAPGQAGIPFDSLMVLFDGIPARGKTLFFDVHHHTGQAELKSAFLVLNELLEQLFHQSGTMSISSASSKREIVMGEQQRNGLFAHLVLEALKSGRADLDSNGTIMLSELKRYMDVEAPKPVDHKLLSSRIEELVSDVALWHQKR